MKEKEMEGFINEVEELLNEIKMQQINLGKQVEKYHKVNMKKFAKLNEFNEICDMTNKVFDKRITNIEILLKQALKQK